MSVEQILRNEIEDTKRWIENDEPTYKRNLRSNYRRLDDQKSKRGWRLPLLRQASRSFFYTLAKSFQILILVTKNSSPTLGKVNLHYRIFSFIDLPYK